MPKLRTAVFADGQWYQAGDDAPESVTNPAAFETGEAPAFTQQTEVVSTSTVYGVDPALDEKQAKERGDKDTDRAPARKAVKAAAAGQAPTK
jgi:hypothetical protein